MEFILPTVIVAKKTFYKTKPLCYRVIKWNSMWNLILKKRDNK